MSMEDDRQNGPAKRGQTAPSALDWYERLLLLFVGACIGGFFFSGIVSANISSHHGVMRTGPTICHPHLIAAKYGEAYGTYFEYITVAYWPWIMWLLVASCTPFISLLRIKQRSRSYLAQVAIGVVISIAVYFTVWRATACATGA